MILRRTVVLLSLALLVLVALVYLPGLSGRFLFDDFPNIVSNTRVHADTLDWAALKSAARGYQPEGYGRPLATISFAVDYAIGGTDPWGYKVSNLLVHLTNALLVFWLLRQLLALPRAGGGTNASWRTPAAFAIALLWAVHPLQISTVLYVVQRMEMLSLTFVLLALVSYLRGRVAQGDGARGWPWLALSALLAGIGLLSKESAVLFPAYALALELTVLRFDAQRPRTRRFLELAFGAGVIATLVVFTFWILPHYTAAGAYDNRDFTVSERLMSQLRVLPMYLGQMLLPLPGKLIFYYDTFPKSTGWLNPATTLAGGVFLLALIAAAWRLRQRMPLVSLGITWFFAAHLLTSNVFNLELVFEHRNYFALLGVLLALADLVRRIPMRDGPALKYVAVGAVVLGFGFLGVLRSASWGSALHLATELVSRNGASTRASMDLGTMYVVMSDSNPDSPFFSMGKQEFERGSRLPNSSPLPEQGLILMAATTGQPVNDEWWDRLVEKIRTRPMGPQEIASVTGLMRQRYEGIELDDEQLSRAYATLLSRGPMPAQMYARYGDYALTYLDDEPLADRQFIEAVNHSRGDPGYPEIVARSLLADGRIRQATLVLEHAEALGLIKVRTGHDPVSLMP